MRRNIRLTGRKQLAQTSFSLSLVDNGDIRSLLCVLRDPSELRGFPPNSEIRVKLVENKLVEVLSFGTVGAPRTSSGVKEQSFRAPSCQVRIVNRSGDEDGKLLGSTSSWVLRSGGDPDGILLFQSASIAPRLWKLDLREGWEELPILYVDDRIPDANLWASSDPLFLAAVLPHVIVEVMRKLLELDATPEDGAAFAWSTWASTMIPGSRIPFGRTREDKENWIDDLIDAFAQRFKLADQVVATLLEAKR
jgi:hypothetical protein